MENIIKTTLDLTSEEGQLDLFNGQNSASGSLRDLDGVEDVLLENILIYKDQKVDTETGEINDEVITVLYTNQGTFGGVSSVIEKSAERLIAFMEATGKKEVPIEVFGTEGANKRTFYNLRIAKSKK